MRNLNIRNSLLAIDAAKFNCIGYTVYCQSTAKYYPEGSSSIKKYFGTRTWCYYYFEMLVHMQQSTKDQLINQNISWVYLVHFNEPLEFLDQASFPHFPMSLKKISQVNLCSLMFHLWYRLRIFICGWGMGEGGRRNILTIFFFLGGGGGGGGGQTAAHF